mgnify:CR=1 FL=1
MHGTGTLRYPSGQIAYEGQWYRDQFHGRGIVYNENPLEFIGEFDYRNFDDLGEYWTKYNGEFVQDVKSGSGVLYLSNGEQFDGYFKDDMIHGRGTYTKVNGQRITGEWQNNRMIGAGY